MRVLVSVLVCVCLHGYTGGGSGEVLEDSPKDVKEAPFITPCHSSDAACLKSSAQKAVPILAAGVPSLGISVLDPMHVARVSTSHAGLDMDFRNTVVKGLRNCKVEALQMKVNSTELEVVCSVLMTGDYKLGGVLLVVPIQGQGRYKIKIRDIVVKIVYDIEERAVSGERYWHVAGWRHSADVRTGVEFRFQNLFNGNKQFADTVHQFANQNWKDIFHEVAPPIVKAIVDNTVTETMKLFDSVPIRKLALP